MWRGRPAGRQNSQETEKAQCKAARPVPFLGARLFYAVCAVYFNQGLGMAAASLTASQVFCPTTPSTLSLL